MRHSSYLREIFEPQVIVRAFIKTVPEQIAKHPGVVYVGTGLSGTGALFILKQAGCVNHIAVVRKSMDCHATYPVELSCDKAAGDCDWVFLDDMISTGDTFRRVLKRFNKDKFLGCMLYHDVPRWRNEEAMLKRYDHDYEELKL